MPFFLNIGFSFAVVTKKHIYFSLHYSDAGGGALATIE